jgi:transcriptional regulator with XRE-family HTH domain
VKRPTVPDGPGAVIRAARHARRVTQIELAATVGCLQSQLSEIEGGRKRLTLLLAARIARALRLPLKRIADAEIAAADAQNTSTTRTDP